MIMFLEVKEWEDRRCREGRLISTRIHSCTRWRIVCRDKVSEKVTKVFYSIEEEELIVEVSRVRFGEE
jgi:hypothetical protein